MAKTILFNITHGFQARMLLRTPIAQHLIDAGATIHVVSPNADEPYFKQEFNRPGFKLHAMPTTAGAMENRLVKFRQYLLMNPSLGGTLNYKREKFREEQPLKAALIRMGNLILGNITPLRKLYMWAENKIFNGSEFDDLLTDIEPDLVVSGTPGFTLDDIHLLRAANSLDYPTVTVMLSWDNITSKGYMGAYPKRLLVWSKLMADEAEHYHNYTGPIHEVGPAQFDHYAAMDKASVRSAFLQKHGMTPDTKLLVWGTINQRIYPNQLDALEAFIQHMADHPPAADYKIWVRLHPQTVTGQFAHMKPVYQKLHSDVVHVEFPPVYESKLAWDLPKADMQHLADLVTAAHVVIMPRSTLAIDAACADTPIVNVAVDPKFARGFNFTHYAKMLTMNGVDVVKSNEELEQVVRAYLKDPTIRKDGRAAVVSQQMGAWFGKSARRTADVLLALAEGAEPED